MTVTLALFGPGDFSTWSADVFRGATRGGPALILSFGVVPMGREYVPQLRKMATDHLDALGIPHEASLAEDAQGLDADDQLGRLADAGFVYMQGGSPRFIIETLRDSLFLKEARRLGVPWVTSSGGTMAAGLGSVDTVVSPMWSGDGLALRPLTFAAHWDTFQRLPGFVDAYLEAAGPHPLVALDEETALLHDGRSWTVFGERRVHVHRDGQWNAYAAGEAIDLEEQR